ncbi:MULTISPECIES: putative glycolipid-binding domain-containing protein [Rhodococcus]|uniref:Glycolipid-binding domain-containing protein n=1 Tax=Rhodococcus artemisiae TaxID=714159 RepID=A0ABU7LIK8_9NOCA|nr:MULTISPECIES: putative glycolipid-binding domain-containing protein [Rhodococcus]MEE2061401.1 putative glycolipid-binding domain-containing protein [Rhodococcus artemisiae]
MSSPDSDAVSPAATPASNWPALLTWRSLDAPRMESVRVQLSGQRIKATGRIVGAECSEHPAFSASYDLVTDEDGVTRRLSVRTTMAAGERHMSISRSGEGIWMVDSGTHHQRASFGGALDVDVILSPFFNALPIRRYRLQEGADELEVPVVYVSLLDLTVQEALVIYSSAADGIHVLSPVSSSSVTVDEDGFVVTYRGLAERI